MFGSLSGWELIFIFVLALLLFGPRQLPKIGRTLGRTMSEFRKATHEFRGSLEREIELDELRSVGKELDATRREAGGAVRDLTRLSDTPRPVGSPAPARPREAEPPREPAPSPATPPSARNDGSSEEP